MIYAMFSRQSFAERLSSLRIAKGSSAREMSLSLGQGAGYINNIENGHNLPSMSVFFEICEYLNITPAQFFDMEDGDPSGSAQIAQSVRRLDKKEKDLILGLLRLLEGKEKS